MTDIRTLRNGVIEYCKACVDTSIGVLERNGECEKSPLLLYLNNVSNMLHLFEGYLNQIVKIEELEDEIRSLTT